MNARIPSHGSSTFAPVHKPKREYGKNDPRSSRPWRRLREAVLVRDKYTCQSVSRSGRQCGKVGTDMEVDHIIPRSRGGEDKLENLQTLCELCHGMKTSTEAATRNASMFPEWMPRSTKRLVLVCGRPAAGKTHYANQHKAKDDLVIDLELMAWEMRRKLDELSKPEMAALIRFRNNRIAAFARGETKHPTCWLLTTAGKPFQREYWQERGAEIVVVDTPLEVCQRRIANEDNSPERKQERLRIAGEWV